MEKTGCKIICGASTILLAAKQAPSKTKQKLIPNKQTNKQTKICKKSGELAFGRKKDKIGRVTGVGGGTKEEIEK